MKKTASSASPASSSKSTNENVEIITRADGKRVRRIRKTKAPNPADKTNQLSGFLESQPKTLHRGGAATVSGASFNQSDKKKSTEDTTKDAPTPKKGRNLGSFLGNMDSTPQKMGSASVAGDQVAISKEQSLTGEVYVRADGKKGKIFFHAGVFSLGHLKTECPHIFL